MTSAKKLDYNFPVLRPVDATLVKRGNRRNPLLIETEEIFSLMGWGQLPDSLKLTIAIDMIGFRDELAGLFSTRDKNVMNRRKRIYFWVNEVLQGNASADAATEALKVSYLQ